MSPLRSAPVSNLFSPSSTFSGFSELLLGKPARVVTKEEPCDSFFNFFKPPQLPEEEEEDEEEEVLSHQFLYFSEGSLLPPECHT